MWINFEAFFLCFCDAGNVGCQWSFINNNDENWERERGEKKIIKPNTSQAHKYQYAYQSCKQCIESRQVENKKQIRNKFD